MIIVIVFLVIALLCVIALAAAQHFRLGALDNELFQEGQRFMALLSENRELGRNVRSLEADISRLKFEATTDVLTGLSNRWGFNLALEKEKARVERFGGALVYFFIDLDRFKAINDTFGHAKGDQVLRAVAAALRKISRSYDLICHLSGDEFVLVLTLREYDEVFIAGHCNKIRSEIWSVTLSRTGIGAACSIGTSRISLEEADAAMYRDKNRGEGTDTVIQE